MYVGLSSPGIMTTILGSAWSTAGSGDLWSSSLWSLGEVEERFRCEHAKITNATLMSASIAAKPPKRYGTGDFHSRVPVTGADVVVGLISLASLDQPYLVQV
jgi:hypothetical protein